MRRRRHRHTITDEEPSDGQGAGFRAWIGPIRGVTGIALIVVLTIITIETLGGRSDDAPDTATEAINARVYLEGLFRAAIAVGVAVGI